MSVVAQGPLAGRTLRQLVVEAGPALVGAGFRGGVFPLMVKMIDAADHLSVQVHPDDATASILGAGARGKTECWVILSTAACYSRERARVSVARLLNSPWLTTHWPRHSIASKAGQGTCSLSRRARCTPWAKVACSTRFSRHQTPPSACTTGTAWAWTDDRGRCTWPSHSRPSISPALVSARYGRPGAPIPQAGSRRAHWSPVPTLLWSNFVFLRERRCAV